MIFTFLQSVGFVAATQTVFVRPRYVAPQVRHRSLQVAGTVEPSLNTHAKFLCGEVVVQSFTLINRARRFTLWFVRVLHHQTLVIFTRDGGGVAFAIRCRPPTGVITNERF